MEGFRSLQWKSVYRAGDQNLFKEFYIPALERSTSYDRAVGFFSSHSLVSNLCGLSRLVANGGSMRLVIGHPLEETEFMAVKQGYRLAELFDDIDQKLSEILKEQSNSLDLNLQLLSLLIASSRLEIKFAFRRKGMYHEKIGVLSDNNGDKLVFQGSANETIYALEDGYNAESIMVFPSWREESFELYGLPCISGFKALWEGGQRNTVTVGVPSSFYERIADRAHENTKLITLIDREVSLHEEADEAFFMNQKSFNVPTIPSHIGNNTFSIRDHQKQAIKSWASNDYKGILKLSTGSGKTITSIVAATKIFEARKKKNAPTVLIVSVPYKELASQWVENLNLFNIQPIRCWESKNRWYDDLKKEVLDINMRALDFLAIVVVNRTMESNDFQSVISTLDSNSMMLIGDECHNHGSKKTNESLPSAFYRMGLSATPFRSDDDEVDSPFPDNARERILAFYGNIVSEYSLGDAINDGVLCEYNYNLIPIFLTAEEQEEYERLSTEIGKLISQSKVSLSRSQRNQLTSLCGTRSRLLGSARNKLTALKELVSKMPSEDRKLSLFYCGEGKLRDEEETSTDEFRVIQAVSKTLSEEGWKTSQFTSAETASDRRAIMSNFVNGDVDALVSMKVLDEGVDVPDCRKAFILASTRNPRQYIQRRGRVLRKAPGKEIAEIFDFITLPTGNSNASRALRAAELERIDDFVLLANNRLSVEKEVDRLALREE